MKFDLDTPLYRFNGTESYTIRQACEGTQIFGGIGSGKTSGSGAALAKAYLEAGMGGLVLCAKNDVLEDWQRYAEQTGRSNSLLVFDTSGHWRFPFLHYETTRSGKGAGYTENLVRLFTTVQEAISRGRSGGGSDPFWQRALEQLTRNSIDLAMLSRGEVSVPLLYDIVLSAPQSPQQRDSEEWRKTSLCWQLLSEANNRQRNQWEQYDFDATVSFWLEDFANLAPKTRSGIVSMFTSMADNFLRRPFRMLFSSMPDDPKHILKPELTHQGIIIVLNLPVKDFGEAGRAAQIVYKYLWQQAAERRDIQQNPRPVFLWIDEAQNFISEYDMQFQATARSSRCCTVYITQNLPNYYAEMGGDHSRHRVDSLIGNMQTKIFHANSDPQTNQFASEVIGRSWQSRRSSGMSYSTESANLSESRQESYDYDVIPQRFTTLSKGGPLNNNQTQAILFQSGRSWGNGRTHFLATFKQH